MRLPCRSCVCERARLKGQERGGEHTVQSANATQGAPLHPPILLPTQHTTLRPTHHNHHKHTHRHDRRAVVLDGISHSVLTAHSVVLCFMAGPLGVLSHWLTKLGARMLRIERYENDYVIYRF